MPARRRTPRRLPDTRATPPARPASRSYRPLSDTRERRHARSPRPLHHRATSLSSAPAPVLPAANPGHYTGTITTLSGLTLQLNSGFILLVWFSPYDCLLLYDLVWDLIKLGDYLSARDDVDPSRIGIIGESLGGMHAWFASFVDTRYSVVVPIIGVQGFQWAIDNDMWQARVDSIKHLFEEARIDSGKSEIDAEVVKKVWDKIAPATASQFDAPYSVPLIAPRPLLLLNGADDPRCPVLGLQELASKAVEAYAEAGSADKFKDPKTSSTGF
ncbi:putative hydrolase YtaP [Triticum dicoccoides]|uniref:putative hydrolase YtaP n=1 Tax=Triticum dicoccoides TaxID=85692 RepID=UPI00188F8870|nr:putative hydrolase YtaP [Triticum dicoccoides]